MSSASSEPDTIKMADPELFRWPSKATVTLKRSIRRGYAKFWAKRGMRPPSERFVPSQYPTKENDSE